MIATHFVLTLDSESLVIHQKCYEKVQQDRYFYLCYCQISYWVPISETVVCGVAFKLKRNGVELKRFCEETQQSRN